MSNRNSQSLALMAQFKRACSTDISVRSSIPALSSNLETIAKELAQSSQVRAYLGTIPSLWPDLQKLWQDLASAQLTFWDGYDSESEDGESENAKQKDLRTLCISLAKFTRNLVAGIPENQTRSFENEPDIRRLLHYHTSWSAMEYGESIPVARVLTQTLSNMVTTNEKLIEQLWGTYMNLPEDQVVLIRLLASPDPRTLLTTLVFILNCIHGSRKRGEMLSRTTIGARVCLSLLDDMLKLYDAEESSEGAKAFDIGYDIFTHLIEQGLVPDLYSKFAIPDTIVTPHQTTLLKILDSYLQSIQMNATTTATSKTIQTHIQLSPMFARCFFGLSAYAQQAVERALGPSHAGVATFNEADTPSPKELDNTAKTTQHLLPAELDVMLPKVCEALVLATQCIITISLEAEEQKYAQQQGLGISPPYPAPNLKDFFNETRSSDRSLIECLIELLRLLDLFLPSINFGRPITSPPSSQAPTPTQQSTADPIGFQYLKRDLVRLLGILCHGAKAVQDRARECGGIQIVMNLCVVDERNPYLREHAIITLHSLLKDNIVNQAVVDAIEPSREWDENGVLQNIPGSIRK